MTALRPPFPFFGGKSRFADLVWSRLGDPGAYAEPFAGSLGILLGRKAPGKVEIVGDANGFISNFWRAVQSDPDAVAYHADYPCYQHDLYARNRFVMRWVSGESRRLLEDPKYFDAEIAGWWLWGVCASPNGSKFGLIDAGAHPETGGRGVNVLAAKYPGEVGSGERLRDVMQTLASRLSRVSVMAGDWTSTVAERRLNGNRQVKGDGSDHTVGVFLDPPYKIMREERAVYLLDELSDTCADDAYRWALQNGDRYRIAYCMEGRNREDAIYQFPEGWDVVFAGKHRIQMRKRFKDRAGNLIAFSPVCLNG